LAEDVRVGGRAAVVDFGGGRMRTALKRADRAGARLVLLLGEEELARGGVTCRNLRTGEQRFIRRADLAAELDGQTSGSNE